MRSRDIGVAIVVLGTVMATSACGGSDAGGAEHMTGGDSPSASSGSGSGGVADPLIAPAQKPDRVTVVALDAQRGSADVGTFENVADGIFVDLTCVGTGEIELDIVNAGIFPLPCSPDGSIPTENALAVMGADYSVRVTAADDQRWALRVSVPVEE